MKQELINLIKEQMGYTETPQRCDLCKFHKQEDGQIDRSWVDICTFPEPIGSFVVSNSGRCERFKRK